MYLAPTSSVSVDQSTEERGRVAAHDARVLRARLKALYERGKRLQELADLCADYSSDSSDSSSSSSSSDSSSDDDDDATEELIQSVRKRRRTLDQLMARHALSYNMASSCSRLAQSRGPSSNVQYPPVLRDGRRGTLALLGL